MLFRVIKLLPLCFVLFISACQSIKVTEKQFLFPDNPITQETLDERGQQQKLVPLRLMTDGAQLGGIAVIQPTAQFTTLYFGGNQSRINQQGKSVVGHLTGFENNLVVFDHRGYGLSSGKPKISNLKTDALAIFDYIKTHPEFSNKPIIVHGLSLGSMIAAELASNRNIDGLVIEGSATTVSDMFDENIPWIIKPFLSIELDEKLAAIDNVKILAGRSMPLMVIVGKKDYQTPLALSEKLFKASSSQNKELVIVEGKGHGNATDSEQFKESFAKFVKTVVGRKE